MHRTGDASIGCVLNVDLDRATSADDKNRNGKDVGNLLQECAKKMCWNVVADFEVFQQVFVDDVEPFISSSWRSFIIVSFIIVVTTNTLVIDEMMRCCVMLRSRLTTTNKTNRKRRDGRKRIVVVFKTKMVEWVGDGAEEDPVKKFSRPIGVVAHCDTNRETLVWNFVLIFLGSFLNVFVVFAPGCDGVLERRVGLKMKEFHRLVFCKSLERFDTRFFLVIHEKNSFRGTEKATSRVSAIQIAIDEGWKLFEMEAKTFGAEKLKILVERWEFLNRALRGGLDGGHVQVLFGHLVTQEWVGEVARCNMTKRREIFCRIRIVFVVNGGVRLELFEELEGGVKRFWIDVTDFDVLTIRNGARVVVMIKEEEEAVSGGLGGELRESENAIHETMDEFANVGSANGVHVGDFVRSVRKIHVRERIRQTVFLDVMHHHIPFLDEGSRFDDVLEHRHSFELSKQILEVSLESCFITDHHATVIGIGISSQGDEN